MAMICYSVCTRSASVDRSSPLAAGPDSISSSSWPTSLVWSHVTVSFSDLGVRPDLVARLHARGLTSPFPIQEATLPDALAGRNVCGRAPTGSGKTLAFGLAVVSRTNGSKPGYPGALILVPTRELAAQVQRELALLAGPGRGRGIAVYGGAGAGAGHRRVRRDRVRSHSSSSGSRCRHRRRLPGTPRGPRRPTRHQSECGAHGRRRRGGPHGRHGLSPLGATPSRSHGA